MSFGIGVGDVILIATAIITTVKEIRNAPEELLDLAARVESVNGILQMCDVASKQQTQFKTGEQSLLAISQQKAKFYKQKVKDVLNKMQRIVEKYKDPTVIDSVKYWASSKRDLPGLEAKLTQTTNDLTTFLTVCNMRLASLLPPMIEEVLANQDRDRQERLDGAEKGAAPNATGPAGVLEDNRHQGTVRERTHRAQMALNSVLQDDNVGKVSSQRDDALSSDIETRLAQAGLGKVDVDALIEMIKKQNSRSMHPEDIDANAYVGGRQRQMEGPTGWIMVVDNYNSVRSIIGQTYLEFVRVWTANITGEWLFNRVESAGVHIETKFSRRSSELLSKPLRLKPGGFAPESAAVKAIAGKESYFRSEEKDDILARIRSHKSRGIDKWHFRKYDYLLCFDRSAYETLEALRKCYAKKHGKNPDYARLAKVVLVKDLPMGKSIDHFRSEEVKSLLDDIKAGLKLFLEEEYHWVKPVGRPIDEGPFRTKQMVVSNNKIMGKLSEKEIKLNEIATETGCRIRITDEKFEEQLFSITGPKEALPLATSRLMKWLV